MTQTISTFFMFNGKAEEAMTFYVSLFEDCEIRSIKRYGANEQGVEGSVMQAAFTLNGQNFMCTDSNTAHAFTFTPSMSIFVDCISDIHIKALFTRLSAGGSILMPLDSYGFSKKFGWTADRFGVSWQLNLPN